MNNYLLESYSYRLSQPKILLKSHSFRVTYITQIKPLNIILVLHLRVV